MPIEKTPPIGFLSLAIDNFRGIDRLDLDFRGPDGQPNPLIVLAGPNGSGKTAVLEAALLAFGGPDLLVGPYGRRAIRKGTSDYEIYAEIQRPTPTAHRVQRVRTTSETDFAETHPREPFSYFASNRKPSLVGSVDVTVGKKGSRRQESNLDPLPNIKRRLVAAAAAQSFAGADPSPFGNYSAWINSANEAWQTFYPGLGDEFAVELAEPDDEGSGAFDVFFKRRGQPRLSIDDLSAGQLELFLFITSLALNNDREGIVFIDEPELHLDPQWHSAVLRTLMKLQPRAQFVVATHSPTIYDAAMSYERHFLVPEDDPRVKIWGLGSRRG